jgi:hypothetical protein
VATKRQVLETLHDPEQCTKPPEMPVTGRWFLASSWTGRSVHRVLGAAVSVLTAIRHGISIKSWATTVATILDKIVVELDAINGTSDATYSNFCARVAAETADTTQNGFGGLWLNDGGSGGVPVGGGLISEVRGVLQNAATSMSQSDRADAASRITVDGLRAFDPSTVGAKPPAPGHGWGFCIDINGSKCPYLIHERGETNLDLEVEPIYNRISSLWTNSHRNSVIPSLGQATVPTTGASVSTTAGVADLYDALKEESDGFQAHFSFMSQPIAALDTFIQNNAGLNLPPAAQLKPEIIVHWTFLANQPSLFFDDVTNELEFIAPAPRLPRTDGSLEDRPFTHSDPSDGFMDALPRALVLALVGAGMEWGACHLGSESGDLMHFQFTRPPGCFARRLAVATAAALASP